MCGRQLRYFSTIDPESIDCITCIGIYEGSKEWYANQLKKNAGPAGRWADVDTPMVYAIEIINAGNPFSWRPIIKDWEIEFSLRSVDE